MIWLFAGHGVLKNGMTSLLLNEFDKSNRFYKMLEAESLIRKFAHNYPNSYTVAIFACCREYYVKESMSGFMSIDEVRAD